LGGEESGSQIFYFEQRLHVWSIYHSGNRGRKMPAFMTRLSRLSNERAEATCDSPAPIHAALERRGNEPT